MGSLLLCFDVDCDLGLEVYGEVSLEDGDLFNQAADQRLVKLCDGGRLALDEILQASDLLHLFILDCKKTAQILICEDEKLPTIGIKSDSRELALCFESYPDFRTVLHDEADVLLAVDRHEFHHAVPEADIVFGNGILAFFQERKIMFDGFAAGILVVDFSLHLVKAALCFLISESDTLDRLDQLRDAYDIIISNDESKDSGLL